MANEETKNQELKSKIETVILESYKKTRDKNFQDLNFAFPKSKSAIAYLKGKIKIFKSLDVYSQTFLSIYTRAKVVLREFQNHSFEGNHLELLRLILTLPDSLGYGKLKSTKVVSKDEIDENQLSKFKVGENLEKKEYKNSEFEKDKTIFIKQGVSGKKLAKQKQEIEFDIQELNELDFEDEEFDNNKINLDGLNL